MKAYQTREIRNLCHKTCYERSAAVRRLRGSAIWRGVEYCQRCDAWHLTRQRLSPERPAQLANMK